MINKFDKAISLTPVEPCDGPTLVEVSVPFKVAELLDASNLVLCSLQSVTPIPLQVRILNRWPDGSIKWLFCRGIVHDLKQTACYQLGQLTEKDHVPQIDVKEEDQHIRVSTGETDYILDRMVLAPFVSVERQGVVIQRGGHVSLVDQNSCSWTPYISDYSLVEVGPVCAEIRMQGEFKNDQDLTGLLFYAHIEIFSQLEQVHFQLRIHNPRAAKHPHNLWDLGDPGSQLLKSLSLSIDVDDVEFGFTGIDDALVNPEYLQEAVLYQESSGGENWSSPVHRNRDGIVPMQVRGWTLSCDRVLRKRGERCQPKAIVKSSASAFAIGIERFWQRFPKAISFRNRTVILGLLPQEFPDLHEIQGGEQITESILFDYGPHALAPVNPSVVACCSTATYRSAGVTHSLFNHSDPGFLSLLEIAHDQNMGFLAKREQLDEYGWRNFGEIYADHEAAFDKGDSIFVSHYNNQYDLLASFYREYLLTSDSRWRELAVDLAEHIADIDINQTREDREEYSLGPFWHTDHYLDAGLSTHRMASRTHLEKKLPHLCGGGPAAEMCYISGLSLHYTLSGDKRFFDLVVQLAEWNWMSLNGVQTIGAAIFRVFDEFSRLRKAKRNDIFLSRYPFTRGTGNCLNSMLEALDLTDDPVYMERAYQLIRGTVHPHDNPDKRNLLDAEVAWSYTVFLMALGRFLLVKEGRGELDDSYCYARDCLLLYGNWMIENEFPYLDRQQDLEFPNDTWIAQDLRKSVILYYAACHQEGPNRKKMLEKAMYFKNYVLEKLKHSDTLHYARIQALVLQNSWVADALIDTVPKSCFGHGNMQTTEKNQKLSVLSILNNFIKELACLLPKLSLTRELKWVKGKIN